jgi:major membrane immunogen (membrane-anchored lipoprotein)
MAKRIGLIALLVVMLFTLCACGNRDHWDTVYTYDTVIVQLADGSVVKGKCQNWRDYENSDMMQVKVDGKTYLVHSMNCSLIAE